MAVDRGVIDRIVELFAGLGHIRCRAMFGGLGVYADDLFFALADPDGQIWVKGDDANEPVFRAEGSEPFTFTYRDGRSEVIRYWRLPDAAYDEAEEALRWGRMGLEAAMRARSEGAAEEEGEGLNAFPFPPP